MFLINIIDLPKLIDIKIKVKMLYPNSIFDETVSRITISFYLKR
jgi:hypothetical protein